MAIPVGVQQTTIAVAVEDMVVMTAVEEIVGVDRGQEVEVEMRTTVEGAEEVTVVTTMIVARIAGAVEEEVAAATG